jgi:hypothetical protein
MAAKNAKKRAKLPAPEPPPDMPEIVWPDGDEFQKIDAWVPDWGRACEVCGNAPCVVGMYQSKVVFDGGMCGVCTWGEAACREPANW